MKETSKPILDPSTGELHISDQFVVSKNIIPNDLFTYYKTDGIDVWDVKNGFIHYTIRDIRLQGTYFFFSFCFFNNKLDSLTFGFKDQPGMLSWADWSREKELKNKAKYDHWLDEQIGTGRSFPWGKIAAYYDPKGGGSGIVLRFS